VGSSSVFITAPNDISVVGNYTFLLNDWQVRLAVEAPCNSSYFVELQEQNQLTVYLGQKATLTVDHHKDILRRPWKDICGEIQHIYLHHAPDFVLYNKTVEPEPQIVLKPKEKADQGHHLMLV